MKGTCQFCGKTGTLIETRSSFGIEHGCPMCVAPHDAASHVEVRRLCMTIMFCLLILGSVAAMMLWVQPA